MSGQSSVTTTSYDPASTRPCQEEFCELCPAAPNRLAAPLDLESLTSTLQARLDLTNATTFHRRSPIVISFYCKCANVYGRLHQLYVKTQANGAQTFQEQTMQHIGDWIVPLFPDFFQSTTVKTSPTKGSKLTTRGSRKKSPTAQSHRHTKASILSAPTLEATCPFVMLISILLPSLRKLHSWTMVTRNQWKLPPSSFTSTAILATFAINGNDPNDHQAAISPRNHVHAMMELHHVLTRVIFECDRIDQIIEMNEDADNQEQGVVSAIGTVQPNAGTSLFSQQDAGLRRIPQIKKISTEFRHVLAELKIQLADLTEVVLATTEVIASRLCHPVSAKSRHISVLDIVQLMVQFVLEPIAERVVASPSTSRLYLFHRMVDKSISVAIDAFGTESIKMNDILGAQIEKAIVHLQEWCSKTEAAFDKLHKSNSAASTDRGHEKTSASTYPYELKLLGTDSMRRLDQILHAWRRRNSKQSDNGLNNAAIRATLKLKESIRRAVGDLRRRSTSVASTAEAVADLKRMASNAQLPVSE